MVLVLIILHEMLYTFAMLLYISISKKIFVLIWWYWFPYEMMLLSCKYSACVFIIHVQWEGGWCESLDDLHGKLQRTNSFCTWQQTFNFSSNFETSRFQLCICHLFKWSRSRARGWPQLQRKQDCLFRQPLVGKTFGSCQTAVLLLWRQTNTFTAFTA